MWCTQHRVPHISVIQKLQDLCPALFWVNVDPCTGAGESSLRHVRRHVIFNQRGADQTDEDPTCSPPIGYTYARVTQILDDFSKNQKFN